MSKYILVGVVCVDHTLSYILKLPEYMNIRRDHLPGEGFRRTPTCHGGCRKTESLARLFINSFQMNPARLNLPTLRVNVTQYIYIISYTMFHCVTIRYPWHVDKTILTIV